MRTVTTPQHSKRRITGYTLIAAAAFLFAAQASFAQEAEQAPLGAAPRRIPIRQGASRV